MVEKVSPGWRVRERFGGGDSRSGAYFGGVFRLWVMRWRRHKASACVIGAI